MWQIQYFDVVVLNHSLKHPKFLWASPQACPWQPGTKSISRQSWTGTSSGSRHMDAAEKPRDRLYSISELIWFYCSFTSLAICYIPQGHVFSNFSNLLYLLSISRCVCLRAPGVKARSWRVHSVSCLCTCPPLFPFFDNSECLLIWAYSRCNAFPDFQDCYVVQSPSFLFLQPSSPAQLHPFSHNINLSCLKNKKQT